MIETGRSKSRATPKPTNMTQLEHDNYGFVGYFSNAQILYDSNSQELVDCFVSEKTIDRNLSCVTHKSRRSSGQGSNRDGKGGLEKRVM